MDYRKIGELDISLFMDAHYKMVYTFFHKDEFGHNKDLDCVYGLHFDKSTVNSDQVWIWRPKVWGSLQMPTPQIISLT